MPFEKRLKEARIRAGMTQADLARAVGVTKGAVGNYESGVSSPKETILIKLMEVLGVDANYLYQDFIRTPVLTDEEARLLDAYRAADERARDDAFRMLAEHPQKKSAKQSAI